MEFKVHSHIKTVSRSEAAKAHKDYRQMLKTEKHHTHQIIEDEHGTWRWKEDPDVQKCLKNISLNDLCPLLNCLGYDKNSEVYRQLYRDMGYSLSSYYEIFYWEMNNDQADEYKPNPSCLGNKQES